MENNPSIPKWQRGLGAAFDDSLLVSCPRSCPALGGYMRGKDPRDLTGVVGQGSLVRLVQGRGTTRVCAQPH